MSFSSKTKINWLLTSRFLCEQYLIFITITSIFPTRIVTKHDAAIADIYEGEHQIIKFQVKVKRFKLIASIKTLLHCLIKLWSQYNSIMELESFYLAWWSLVNVN
jgi:hypothetical protein